jgi:trk system potassium uptake protein
MKIIIAGAGAVGTHLAKLLSREKQDIILMDDDEEKLSTLSSNFDLMTVTASPSSISGLKEVGIKEADLFIAVTPDESRNMTACMLATNLGAEKTVARIDNYEYLLPKNKEFFQKLGVDSLIYPEMLAAKEIVSSMRMSWVRQWWEFCGGSLILIGTKMREKAEILNVTLAELGAPDIPYHVVAIKRGTETIIPRGDDTIKLHDIVYFTTTRKYIPYIRKIATIGAPNSYAWTIRSPWQPAFPGSGEVYDIVQPGTLRCQPRCGRTDCSTALCVQHSL